jgi:hypothetical protein
MPVIAHLDGLRPGGRFVLVFAPGNVNYGLIDGTTATIKDLPADEFRRNWSGYVLVADLEDRRPWMLSAGTGILMLAIYAWWRVRRPVS